MLQQRFFDNFYFFACGFYFLIKFFLFFVQFSVHFLFFTCFFLLQKNTASFPFFIVAHPLTHLILFVFVSFFLLTESSGPVTVGCEPAKTWPLHGGPKAGTFASKNRSMGFCWFACVFLYGCVIFVLLWVYVVFLYISIHICNIFVICNIYTWFCFCFVSRTVCYL